MINIKRLSSLDSPFNEVLDALLAFETTQDNAIIETVARILSEIRTHGDSALLDYTRHFDHLHANTLAELELPMQSCQQALQNLSPAESEALKHAAQRIKQYHEKQLSQSGNIPNQMARSSGKKSLRWIESGCMCLVAKLLILRRY